MLLGLCLISLTCLGLAIVATLSHPSGETSRRRDLELGRHPERVTVLDVEHLLLAASVARPTVDRVMARARDRRLGARTMWRWIAAHGGHKLVLVVDADLAEDTLLDHLDAGTAPEWDSLRVLAGLNNDTLPAGMPIAELIDLDSIPSLDDLTFPTDLADWTTAPESDEAPRSRGGEGDWPDVA